MTLDVIYLLAERGLMLDRSPGLAAQIIDRIEIQSRHGVSAAVVAVATDTARFDSTVGETLDRLAVPYRLVGAAPAPIAVVRAACVLRSFQKRKSARTVYVRDPWSSLAHQLAFPLSGPELVYDMRGDVIAESEHRGRSWLRRTVLKQLTRRGIRHADRHMAVSSQAARQLSDQFGAGIVTIVPSCVDYERFQASADRRNAVRAELGIADGEVLAVYSGGTQAYQMIPETLDIWARMAVHPDVRFLLLTHGENFSRSPAGIPEDRFLHVEADRSEIPAYLAAADIGFLLRAPHQLNYVASPIKFGEYLAAGLSVVSSPGIGDVSSAIEHDDLGCIVNLDDVESAAADSLNLALSLRDPTNRMQAAERARRIARERYDWAAYINLWNQEIGPEAV